MEGGEVGEPDFCAAGSTYLYEYIQVRLVLGALAEAGPAETGT